MSKREEVKAYLQLTAIILPLVVGIWYLVEWTERKKSKEPEFVRQLCSKVPGFLSKVESSNYTGEPMFSGKAAIWITGDGATIFHVAGEDNNAEEQTLKTQYSEYGWFMDPRKPATSSDHLTEAELAYPGNGWYQDAKSLLIVKLSAHEPVPYGVFSVSYYKKTIIGRTVMRDEPIILGCRNITSSCSFVMTSYRMRVWIIDLGTEEITGYKEFFRDPPDCMLNQAEGQCERDTLMDWIREME